MTQQNAMFYTLYVSLIVALGGFLMGFDASVISGVVGFIEGEFQLDKIELGWAVASLSLAATVAMLVAGPLSDRLGRKKMLTGAAVLYFVSALGSAFAPDFVTLVAARMVGGLGVGTALIIAPMYIAEISPAALRGRMVSMNQLNIVIGISVAFFSNYMIIRLAQGDSQWVQDFGIASHSWRWMLGLEALPALLYLLCLALVPESPRWLIMHGQQDKASTILQRTIPPEQVTSAIRHVEASLANESGTRKPRLGELLSPALRLVMILGISVAVLQQITGINAVFFYAPMIFEMAGQATDAAFLQAVLVGVINLVFTLVAIGLIDKLGRRKLLLWGTAGIALSMLVLSHGFSQATYVLQPEHVSAPEQRQIAAKLAPMFNQTFDSDVVFKQALSEQLLPDETDALADALTRTATVLNPWQILGGILGFVACFAVSLGPVMWVLFSELFPNYIRGLAISIVGLVNSGVSFAVQLLFPWELANFGAAATFLGFGLFAIIGFVIILRLLPETKGHSLEDLEKVLQG